MDIRDVLSCDVKGQMSGKSMREHGTVAGLE